MGPFVVCPPGLVNRGLRVELLLRFGYDALGVERHERMRWSVPRAFPTSNE
jgi:hypothetical protein